MTPAQDNCSCSPRHNPECAYMKGGYCTMTPAQDATALIERADKYFGNGSPMHEYPAEILRDMTNYLRSAAPQTPDAVREDLIRKAGGQSVDAMSAANAGCSTFQEPALSTPSASAGPQDRSPMLPFTQCAQCWQPATCKKYGCRSRSAGPQAEAVAWRCRWNSERDWNYAEKPCSHDDHVREEPGFEEHPLYAHPQPQQADTIAWLCEYDGHTDATTDPDTVRIWRETLGRKITPLGPQQAEGRDGEINHYETTSAGVIDWKMEAERANRLLASADGRGTVIEDVRKKAAEAIRTFCKSLGAHTVSISSDGIERIYYPGLSLDAIAAAVALALSQAPATDKAK